MTGATVATPREFLSLMPGVRRSGVTVRLYIIEGLGTVRATRGNIRVLDRVRLEEVAGSCTVLPEQEYERLIGTVEASARLWFALLISALAG